MSDLKSTQICYGENVLMMRVDDCLIFGNKDALRRLAEKLTELPSAEPERKKGKYSFATWTSDDTLSNIKTASNFHPVRDAMVGDR